MYASTGITASTSEVVGDVRKGREDDRTGYDAMEARYMAIYDQAEPAIQAGDWPTVGRLANENHALLQDLGVSCTELDTLVDAARAAGAIGAKMSGTGRGGLMLAITPDAATQDAVAAALEKIAPQVWKTSFA